MSAQGESQAQGYEAKHPDPKIEADRQMLRQAQAEGRGSTLKAFVRLSGPGWLQSAITLGGGSLGGSLFLGVIGGYEMMWFQPLVMILGVIMLSGIAYVTLSTGEKPFQAINKHINPVLGWGWLIAAALANMVWAMPQFGLGAGALQQNLLPGLLGDNGAITGQTSDIVCIVFFFAIAAAAVWYYDSGGTGIKVFEGIIKAMIAAVVISFFGVVIALAVTGQLPWGEIGAGLIPDLTLLFHPAEALSEAANQTQNASYWISETLSTQRDRMAATAATAVGINMTFLLPYSMLRKGWDSNFRGLASFDLGTGLFIPFVLATGCVVIATASQFHGEYNKGLLDESKATPLTAQLEGRYHGNLDGLLLSQDETMQSIGQEYKEQLLSYEGAPVAAKVQQIQNQHDAEAPINAALGRLAYNGVAGIAPLVPSEQKQQMREALPRPDKKMAAMLVKRDVGNFATSLTQLFERGNLAQFVFGIGVVGMAISTIMVLMLINGFCLTEAFNLPLGGLGHRIGSIIPGITGGLGYFVLWTNPEVSNAWLVIPASVFGMALLPIAYVTFLLMMNSKALLGEHRPTGLKRGVLNLFMSLAVFAAGVGAGYAIWSHQGWKGVAAVAAFVGLAVIVQLVRAKRNPAST
jgi:hypothetical protein